MISQSNPKLSKQLPEIESLNKESGEEPIWRKYDDFNSSK